MNDPFPTVEEPIREESPSDAAESTPSHIGRYRIERALGQGGFGLVYLAHDDQLQRLVAIKVPHARLVAQTTDAEAYLSEARAVAHLDHPNIVPVYDVGSTGQYPCFVVSKYIDGTDLATRLKQAGLTLQEGVDLVATVAEALHHAHGKGLVHRDIKPGNLLLDQNGKVFVADFGLALREQDLGKGPCFAGTPAYMSPEQARGEGHRVDGRSDIFSLGVVFYELLSGRRPFQGNSPMELLEQITNLEARPPRQSDDRIPRELERICLKALAERASERYLIARDFADDLRHFLTGASREEKSPVLVRTSGQSEVSTPLLNPPRTQSEPPVVKIVPKGLRSFDANDADFFLELLPGPRDRQGLPETLRFWKNRIEESDPDNSFSVGLIYGPSGCGKSSLVKAGLLPRLTEQVVIVYVEASAEGTEARLLRGLRRRCPTLPENLGLVDTLTALRQGHGLASGQKVLLVLDQLEQWLHVGGEKKNLGLVQALRQCDGERVQGLLLVRDDLWMATTRLFEEVEIALVHGKNCAGVDLFDLRHARKVLAAFGVAFGALLEPSAERLAGQQAFLDQAIAGLAQDDRVICVRLALFAEMVKGRPWTLGTLKEIGGMARVGVAFLEETFHSLAANPANRLHQKAARAVLKTLLPPPGLDIKGHMRSREELLQASGYARRLRDFEELLVILDKEYRLITPAELSDREFSEEPKPAPAAEKHYQLTHDYLVPALRDWLTDKQKETWRGRAELRLAERAAIWSAKPENRHLPSWWEWLTIWLFTHGKGWTVVERKMMRRAGGFLALWSLALIAFGLALAWTVQAVQQTFAYEGKIQVDRLFSAEPAEIPGIIAEIKQMNPRWTVPHLREALAPTVERKRTIRASLALLPDSDRIEYLYRCLLDAEAEDATNIIKGLAPYHEGLTDLLWGVMEQPAQGFEGQRLRAACALAQYDPENQRWANTADPVVQQLVKVNSPSLKPWTDTLQPVKTRLLVPLRKVFDNREAQRASERLVATTILAGYAGEKELLELAVEADSEQFAALFPKLEKEKRQTVIDFCQKTLQPRLDQLKTSKEKERLASRQANAAVILLRLKEPPQDVWPLLKHSPDPRLRSWLIHRLGALGVPSEPLIDALLQQPELEVSIRRALILSLGEFQSKQLPAEKRQRLLKRLLTWYRSDPDAGIHAAVDWLLRNGMEGWRPRKLDWQEGEALRQIDQNELAGKPPGNRHWYVTAQAHTMVLVRHPEKFRMGSSPKSEEDRRDNETPHDRQIPRSFAIASKDVTVAQFYRFLDSEPLLKKSYEKNVNSYKYTRTYSPQDGPMISVNWYEAAQYCNWLSQQEKIDKDQWCYEPNGAGQYADGMKMKPKYLSLTGYRLPTEAEWEYACRAGSTTSRFYGDTEELLGNYAWYVKNSRGKAWPVGQLKPNDLGLFDILGNVWNWCNNRLEDYPKGGDEEAQLLVLVQDNRAMRGGSFLNYPQQNVRSAYRSNGYSPILREYHVGLRVARTIDP